SSTTASAIKRSYDGVFVLVLFVLFIGVLAFIYTASPMSDVMKIITGLAFALGTLIGFVMYRSHKTTALRDHELELVREVMEGSRGARLITDSADNTLYLNQKFESLCRGVGPPGLTSLLRLFETSEEATAHFRILADQAHRGLTDSIELFSVF